MQYKLVKQVKEIDILRNSFNDLAIETFDLSFENWYKNGFWTNKYIPYVLVHNDKAIANASVNVIHTLWNKIPKCYIQIGTVMTDLAYRNQGLSRHLMNEIIAEWKDNCDAIYLYANDTVLDFYPKFGFSKAVEHQYSMQITPAVGDFEKLDMDKKTDQELLRRCYERSNPFSKLPMKDNYGLIMFYCTAFLKNNVYYSKKYDAICIARQDKTTLDCFDIFCSQNHSMDTILAELASSKTNKVILFFTPKNTANCECTKIVKEDETLFILPNKDNIFEHNKIMFPALSHA